MFSNSILLLLVLPCLLDTSHGASLWCHTLGRWLNNLDCITKYTTTTATSSRTYICDVSSNCQCRSGYNRVDNTTCQDVDECQTDSSTCKAFEDCVNKHGEYECVCKAGYKRKHQLCIDINECVVGTDECDRISQACINKAGKYSCKCKTGFTVNTLDLTATTCIDINECHVNSSLRPCGYNQLCRNSFGSYKCVCEHGYEMEQAICIDIDECTRGTHKCSDGCENTVGGYYCTCPSTKRFQRIWGDRVSRYKCVDKDECAEGADDCDKLNGICTNIEHGYRCSCKSGFLLGQSDHTCNDIDDCNLEKNKNVCSQRCVNTPGSWHCDCDPGYELFGDSTSCGDINECKKSQVCSQLCFNTKGSYKCTCDKGYTLNADGYTCDDEDECLKPGLCHSNAICKNSVGYYTCHCKDGFIGDGRNKCEKIRCPYLAKPRNGDVSSVCKETEPVRPTYQTICHYTCKAGHTLTGLTVSAPFRKCTKDGSWTETSPSCTPKRCSSLHVGSTVKNVYPLICTSSRGVPVGTRCRITCARGYEIEENSHKSVKCMLDKYKNVHWVKSIPKCKKAFIRPKISCPGRVKVVVLASGKATFSLRVPTPTSNVPLDKVTVSPPVYIIGNIGIFKPGLTSIKFTATSGKENDSCIYNVRVQDLEKPTVQGCPSDMTKIVKSKNEIGTITWTEPTFHDNVKISNKIQDIFPKQKFTIGNYVVKYTVFDPSGNSAVCQFKIHIKTKDCGKPLYNDKTTNVKCDGWEEGVFCTVECKQGKQKRKFIIKPQGNTFVCGKNGVWHPSKIVPACVEYNRISRRNRRRPCPSGKIKDIRRKVCLKCPEGTYLDGKQCTVCPIGKYSDREASTSCLKCPEGKTTVKSGTTSITNCIGPCPAGTVSVSGAEPCQPCPISEYQPDTAKHTCIVCPYNATTKAVASTSLENCSASVTVRIDHSRRLLRNKGEDVTMTCYGAGFPKPSVTWSRKDVTSAYASLTSVASEGGNFKEVSLRLDSLVADDAGLYLCTADNGYGQPATETVLLLIRKA